MQASRDGNRLSDFPPDQFTIHLFCDAFGHQADLDRGKVPGGITVQELSEYLRCAAGGSSDCSLRIIDAGAGGFR